MMWRKISVHDSTVDSVDYLSEDPSRSFWNSCVIGIFGALGFFVLGLVTIAREHAFLPFSDVRYELRGNTAIAVGIMWIFWAAFVHFHFAWSTHFKLCHFADSGKVVSLIGFCSSLFYVICQIFANWFRV